VLLAWLYQLKNIGLCCTVPNLFILRIMSNVTKAELASLVPSLSPVNIAYSKAYNNIMGLGMRLTVNVHYESHLLLMRNKGSLVIIFILYTM
jgi:hypothetical protein